MRVVVPSPLADYTDGRREVEARGDSVRSLLLDLDDRYPGIRFRIIDEQDHVRPHIKLFVNGNQTKNLAQTLAQNDAVIIVAALSGG
jgi:sulfur-carrier protein